MLPDNINMLELTLSNICDSRCQMCDIGTGKFRRKELALAEIEKIIDSDIAKKAEVISLCGGEPFLRKDFVSIIKITSRKLGKKFNLNISTNGLNTEKITADISQIRNYANIILVFSVDGLKKTHDKQRGVKGAFERTVKTIDSARRKFPEVGINIHFTITPINYREILKVYRLAKSKNAFFRAAYAHNTFYLTNFIKRNNPLFKFNKIQIRDIESQLNRIMKDYIKEGNFGDALFLNQIPRRLREPEYRFCRCFTSYDLVLIKENGDVHICVMSEPVGNINKENLGKILFNKKAQKIRKTAEDLKCPNCLMLCGSYFNYNRIGRMFGLFYNRNKCLLQRKGRGILTPYPLTSNKAIKGKQKKAFVSIDSNTKNIRLLLKRISKKNSDFELSKPIAPCWLSLKEKRDLRLLAHPKSCLDCREMFTVDEKGTVAICQAIRWRKIGEELQKQMISLRNLNKEKSCYNNCNPFLRNKCLCLANTKK